MVDLGSYAGPVLLAYGATFGLLAVLVIASVARARRVKHDLAETEKHNA